MVVWQLEDQEAQYTINLIAEQPLKVVYNLFNKVNRVVVTPLPEAPVEPPEAEDVR